MTADEWNQQVVSGCHRSYNGIPMLTDRQRMERDAMLDRERLATRLAFADAQAPKVDPSKAYCDTQDAPTHCRKCERLIRIPAKHSNLCGYCRRIESRKSSARR